ncbi:Uncharacterized protein Fot_08565 [Forsythia ovata]|uniref:Uncharacterized protein n=1 Tax=Forsythia ovata TaxID=205694 RepID=A0ABD1WZE5_9LAMI
MANKRYHSRLGAPELVRCSAGPVGNELESQLASTKKGKLVPNRDNEGRSSQPQETNPVYHFMPTPGLDLQGKGKDHQHLHYMSSEDTIKENRLWTIFEWRKLTLALWLRSFKD